MTSVGVELRVKIAISAGKIYCTHVGLPGQMRHIAMSGNPVGEVNAAEKHCESGDVVLSPNAWDVCNRDVFKGYEVGDGRHKFFKVHFITRKDFSDLNDEDGNPKWKWKSPYKIISENKISSSEKVDREACRLYNNPKIENYIRKYISKTVQEKLDDGQPVDYLSEIRQCTILFINLVFDLKEQRRDYTVKLGNTLQASFGIVDDELRSKGGQLNKLFMFDKGCTFLAAFGLPGTKNEREAALALECAFQISKRMTSEIIELNRCSIGVTTGSVYVGVIGHEERHEYSFLGPKVNMAARIMMAGYPGMVNCDALTMKCSDLSPDYFIAQAFKPLKGIKDPGTIYQYTETMPPLTSYLRRNVRSEYPILGRIDEIDRIMAETCSGEDRCFVVIEGEKGIGKTRLLEEIVIISQNIDANLHVVNIATSYDIMKDDFKLVRIIIEDLLGIIDLVDRGPGSEAEAAILETLKGSKFSADDQTLLNPIFGTFINNKPLQQSQVNLTASLERQCDLIQYIMGKCLDNFERTLICVDCAQFIDSASWKLLSFFANDSRASIVLAYRPQIRKDLPDDKNRIDAFKDVDNLHINLRFLPNEYFPALTCQMLRVTQISETLTAAIIYKSFGNPGWTLLILKALLDNHHIEIVAKGEGNQICHQPPQALITSRKLQFAETAKNAAQTASGSAKRGSGLGSTTRSSSRMTRTMSKSILNRSVVQKKEKNAEDDYKHPAVNAIAEEDDYDIPKRDTYNDSDTFNKKHNAGKQYIDILKKIGGYYEDVLNQAGVDTEMAAERECIISGDDCELPLVLQRINAPQVIKSFILQQLDRLPPTTQQVAKECALVGEYFSRHVIYHLNQGTSNDKDKVDRAFQQLIDAKIIEPIKTTVDMSRNANTGLAQHQRKSSLVKKINFKGGSQCDHLRFINSFYQEVVDNLWLDEQRQILHLKCAKYYRSCIEELKDDSPVSQRTIIEFAVHREAIREITRRQKSVCNILNINIQEFEPRKVSFDASKLKFQLLLDDYGLPTKMAVVDDWPCGQEAIGKLRSKQRINQQNVENAEKTSRASVDPQAKKYCAKHLPADLNKSIVNRGTLMESDYTARLANIIDCCESQGKNIKGILPAESVLFLSILCPVLMKHCESGRETKETLVVTLEAADALLKTGNLKDALSYLDKADEIIINLSGTSKTHQGKYDMIKDQYEGDTNFHNLDETITVYVVPDDVKAYYETLIGDARILMGDQDKKIARRNFETALRLLGERGYRNCTTKIDTNKPAINKQIIELWERVGHHEFSLADRMNMNKIERVRKRLKACGEKHSSNLTWLSVLSDCAFINSLEPGRRKAVSESEREAAKTIEDMDASVRYEEVYAIHKFYATDCHARIAMGDLDGALQVATYLTKLGQYSNSKSLYWISQIYTCEVLLAQDKMNEFFTRIRKVETEMEVSLTSYPEIQCQINILKLNAILDNGFEIDNFSDITLWVLPFGGCSFSNLQIACFSACIALFNVRTSQMCPSNAWRENAWKHMVNCPISYPYVRAFSRLLECDLIAYRNSIFYNEMPHITMEQVNIRNDFQRNLAIFESYCVRMPIFIPRFLLFKSYFQMLENPSNTRNNKVQHSIQFLETGIQAAQVLGDVTSKTLLNANLEYVKNIATKGARDHWVKNILANVGANKIEKKEKAKKCYYIFTRMPEYPWHP
jgi:class 3 adenylate cyclase/tetratricopeptide (TPR) repeat protein